MLMHFIPKMKYSKCGHFITIQPIITNRKPLLSSYGEIKSLINLLTDNQSTFALDLFNRQKIHLTTVMWNCDESNISSLDCNGHNNNNSNPAIKHISERILDGIRANRSVVHINKANKINLISSIRSYFQKEQTSNVNCNGHNKVRWWIKFSTQASRTHWIHVNFFKTDLFIITSYLLVRKVLLAMQNITTMIINYF